MQEDDKGNYWVNVEVGAQGFEPCPAGFFFRTAASFCESCGKVTGRCSSWSSTFSKPTRRHSRATGARSTTKLYYTPNVCTKKRSALCLAACTSSSSQFFLAPFPALIAGLLPRTASSLHGERLADQHSVYDSIGWQK